MTRTVWRIGENWILILTEYEDGRLTACLKVYKSASV